MKTVHSFAEVAKEMGMKMPKAKKVVVKKCANCGGALRRVDGTNVYVCDFSKLEDSTLPDGTEVQVFSKCGNTEIADVK